MDNTVRLAGTCVYEDCGGPFGFGFIFSKTAACVVNHLLFFFFFVVVLCGVFFRVARVELALSSHRLCISLTCQPGNQHTSHVLLL